METIICISLVCPSSVYRFLEQCHACWLSNRVICGHEVHTFAGRSIECAIESMSVLCMCIDAYSYDSYVRMFLSHIHQNRLVSLQIHPQVHVLLCYMKMCLDLQRAQNGPTSQHREFRQYELLYGVHYFGYFEGPGTISRSRLPQSQVSGAGCRASVPEL